jgi:formate dehydrogenase major subunit
MAVWDMENADCVIVMGSNMAENHPIAFRFVVEAQRRGATLVHVDPRFTRTSALAQVHAPIRSGTDIAFLGGLIRYVIENDLWFRDYAMAYTNIAQIIEEGYEDPEQNEGIFSGFNTDTHAYDNKSWQAEGKVVSSTDGAKRAGPLDLEADGAEPMSTGPALSDPTLQHPNCVYQIMKRHYARYTPEMVEQITGCPKETFLKVADTLAKNSGRDRTTAFCYAVGWTHHSYGVQIIRAAALLQGLMGNVGRPGGGVMALRGHVSIQGSTDIPTLYNMLPTYLTQPAVFSGHASLEDYLRIETPATGWWSNTPKYVVSLMKAWYGEHATKENEFAFHNVPKLTSDCSNLPMTFSMADGLVKGQFILGQNPCVGGVNSEVIETGFAKLDWMVVRDFAMTETADFWKSGRRIQKGQVKAEDIGTEMFFLPASMPGEKEGTVTNTSRLVQWHDWVCDSPGDSRSDLWFMYHLGVRLKELYAGSTRPQDKAIQDLTWDYPTVGDRQEPEAEAVLKEINGYTVADRKQVAKFPDLKDDGSTACGGWSYCGIFPEEGKNLSRSHKPDAPGVNTNHKDWAFAWPSNRRNLYNRASADPDGKPWSERKKLVWWDEADAKWTGHDVPDFEATKRPDYKPDWRQNPKGMDAISGASPFIMEASGKIQVFVSTGLADGPLPAYYEPVESPTKNAFYRQQTNPTARIWGGKGNEIHGVGDKRFPYVFTTYRLTEMHCGGIATRVMPHTAELQPESFVEMSPELAKILGVKSLDWTVISTLRGEIEVKALVTERMRPFQINGETVHQVGMPWVYGWKGYAHGAVANALLAIYGDANTSIHTTKAITCNVRAGRIVADQRIGL